MKSPLVMIPPYDTILEYTVGGGTAKGMSTT